MLQSLANFVSELFSILGRQLVIGLGLPVLLGVTLFFLQRYLQQTMARLVGWKAVVYYTGWIGTPIHEASHYVVGRLFGITIDEVKFFEPDLESGVLGYVRYRVPRFELKNTHRIIGTCMMGLAPLLGGGLVLAGGLLLIAPHEPLLKAADQFAHLSMGSGPADVVSGFFGLIAAVWNGIFHYGWLDPRPWLFIYLALGVGAHLAPSKKDLEGAWPGALVFLGLLLTFDAVGLLVAHLAQVEVPVGKVARAINTVTGPLAALLVLALAINLGNLVIVNVVARTVRRFRKGRKSPKPKS